MRQGRGSGEDVVGEMTTLTIVHKTQCEVEGSRGSANAFK